METTADVERSRLYEAAARGVEIIRSGLKNIGASGDKFHCHHRNSVSPKYDVSSNPSTSRLAHPEKNVSLLKMGHGFGTAQIHNPNLDFIFLIKGIPSLFTSDSSFTFRSNGGDFDCARVVTESEAEFDTSRSVISISTPSSVISAINKPLKCVFTKKILPIPECGGQSGLRAIHKKSMSFHNGQDVSEKSVMNGPSRKHVLISEITGHSHCRSAGSVLANHARTINDNDTVPRQDTPSNVAPLINILPELERDVAVTHFCKSHVTSSPVHVKGQIVTSVSAESERNNSVKLGSNCNHEEKVTGTVSIPSLLSNDSKSPGHLDTVAQKGKTTTAAFGQDCKTDVRPLEYVLIKEKNGKTMVKETVLDTIQMNHGELQSGKEALPSTQPLCGIQNSMIESPDLNTAYSGSPASGRKRSRPRRSKLNTDRKMWMSSGSPRSHIDQDQDNQAQPADKGDVSLPTASPVDMIIRVFGYNPSEDAFRNVKTDHVCQSRISTDVPVPILYRHEVQFYKNDDNECIISHQGSSSVLYLGCKDGKDVLVKDSSQNFVSAEDVLREARILSILDGTSVTPRFHGILEQGVMKKEYCIIQDKCEGFLSLKELLESGYYISNSNWMKISLSLANHLMTLHSHRLLHNNICLDNILVNKDSLEVKFVGFGQATYSRGFQLSCTTRSNQGLSPEIIYGCVTSPESDVYALGSVLEHVMRESRVMSLHHLVMLCHENLPRDRPQANEVFFMIKDICDKL